MESVGLAESSKKRISNDFRAALNAAVKANRARLPRELPLIIKEGLEGGRDRAPVARHGQALPDEMVRRIVEAAKEVDDEEHWDDDFHRLVSGLAASGTRFSQLIRMTVGDFQAHYGRMMLPVSRKGSIAKAKTHVGFAFTESFLSDLTPITVGRDPNERLFERWYRIEGKRVNGRRNWEKAHRGPWKSASQMSPLWRKVIAKVGLGDDVVPYALRHSSIVRMLRARVPVSLVAELHDTSEQVIRRHYAAEIVDALSDIVSKTAFDLSPKPAKVSRLPVKRRG